MTVSNIESIMFIVTKEENMEQNKVTMNLTQYKEVIPSNKIIVLKNALTRADDSAEENLSCVKIKNPIVILILSIFLGGLGVDRFAIGDIGLGICKLLFGWLTFGLWPLIDIFCSYKKAKDKISCKFF